MIEVYFGDMCEGLWLCVEWFDEVGVVEVEVWSEWWCGVYGVVWVGGGEW